ncbi:MAG: alpha/beta hydrolase family protein [Promethearchaeota archaeon]
MNIIEEKVDIPIAGTNLTLKGSIYYSEQTPKKAPFIINVAGLNQHRGKFLEKFFSEQFASKGFYVLGYDHRAHGETSKQTGSLWLKHIKEIFNDINRVISWILETQRPRLLNDRIFMFGRSFGGAMILTRGYSDNRVEKLIALCTRYDYHTTTVKFPEDIISKISPMNVEEKKDDNNSRILIAHCRDDKFIPFENLEQIKDHFGLSDSNVIKYDTGGHAFSGHREDIIKRVIDFSKFELKNKLEDNFSNV